MRKEEIRKEAEFAVKYHVNSKVMSQRILLRKCILNENLVEIKHLLKNNKSLVNSRILVNGYTPLHLACLMGEQRVVELLVKHYHADVNIFAVDGTQPIHLNSFTTNYGIPDILLEAGANVEAEITEKIYLKYRKMSEFLERTKWCSDFGNTMTLVTFDIIVHDVPALAHSFIKFGANLNITSRTNQTLMMHMCKKGMFLDNITSANNLGDSNIVIARDDDGFTALNYAITSCGFAAFPCLRETKRANNLLYLVSRGADINASVNGDPDTIPINIAAKGGFYKALEFLLPRCADFITQSKALNYFFVSFRDSKGNVFDNFTRVDQGFMGMMNYLGFRDLSAMLILQDLVNRLEFGLYVSEDEENLFNQLIKKHLEVKNFVRTYRENAINGILKNKVIQYGDKSITFYDFVSMSVDTKKLQLFIKDQTFMDAFKKSSINFDEISYFKDLWSRTIDNTGISYFGLLIKARIERASKRTELMKKLKKLKQLRKTLPLPYELILEIVDYLGNNDLSNFIDAFYLDFASM